MPWRHQLAEKSLPLRLVAPWKPSLLRLRGSCRPPQPLLPHQRKPSRRRGQCQMLHQSQEQLYLPVPSSYIVSSITCYSTQNCVCQGPESHMPEAYRSPAATSSLLERKGVTVDTTEQIPNLDKVAMQAWRAKPLRMRCAPQHHSTSPRRRGAGRGGRWRRRDAPSAGRRRGGP